MTRTRRTALLATVLLLAVCFSDTTLARKRTRKPPKDMDTQMCERGELLFSDDFSGDKLSDKWKVALGDWQIVDGALKGTELEKDDHAAVIRHEMEFKNMIVQMSFKFEGGKSTGIGMNNSSGHVCRLSLNPHGFSVHKDRPRRDSDEEGVTLDKSDLEFEPGQWYTILLELYDKEMVAYLDKAHFAFGEHEKVAVDKTNFSIHVAGEDIYFDDIRVWEARPYKKWAKSKKKLAAIKAYLKRREEQK